MYVHSSMWFSVHIREVSLSQSVLDKQGVHTENGSELDQLESIWTFLVVCALL